MTRHEAPTWMRLQSRRAMEFAKALDLAQKYPALMRKAVEEVTALQNATAVVIRRTT